MAQTGQPDISESARQVQHFPYHVESLRAAWILIGVEAIIAIIAPGDIRWFAVMWLSGPLLWVLLQLARRHCAITLYADRLVIRSVFARHAAAIPRQWMRAYWVNPNNQLVLYYLQPRPTQANDPDPRPPRTRLLVSGVLETPEQLKTALASIPSGNTTELRQRLRMRQTRRILIICLLIAVGVPLLIVLGLQIAFSLGIGSVL